MRAPQEALLSEDVDEVEAHLLPTAIGRGRCGTAAMARRARARVSVAAEKTERERGLEREVEQGSEGAVQVSLSTRGTRHRELVEVEHAVPEPRGRYSDGEDDPGGLHPAP